MQLWNYQSTTHKDEFVNFKLPPVNCPVKFKQAGI